MDTIIKFRAKSKLDNNWLYGFPHTYDNLSWYMNQLNTMTSEIDQTTLCQYTGLNDINGSEIYTGDILKPFGAGITHFEVKFEDYCYVVYNNYGRWGTLSRFVELSQEFDENIIKIGDIYEKLELI